MIPLGDPNETSPLSRRDFLKFLGYGTAAASATALLSGCNPKESSLESPRFVTIGQRIEWENFVKSDTEIPDLKLAEIALNPHLTIRFVISEHNLEQQQNPTLMALIRNEIKYCDGVISEYDPTAIQKLIDDEPLYDHQTHASQDIVPFFEAIFKFCREAEVPVWITDPANDPHSPALKIRAELMAAQTDIQNKPENMEPWEYWLCRFRDHINAGLLLKLADKMAAEDTHGKFCYILPSYHFQQLYEILIKNNPPRVPLDLTDWFTPLSAGEKLRTEFYSGTGLTLNKDGIYVPNQTLLIPIK